jgi:hypothetical protein
MLKLAAMLQILRNSGVALVLAFLVACSGESFQSAAEAGIQRIQESQRDGVIRNYQRRISDEERCAHFKERLLTEGQRYDGAANAAFHVELGKVKKAAARVGCLRDQEQERPRALIYKSGDGDGALRAGEDPKEAAWSAFYKPSPECLKTVSVECGNEYMRARKEFERRYEAGEL